MRVWKESCLLLSSITINALKRYLNKCSSIVFSGSNSKHLWLHCHASQWQAHYRTCREVAGLTWEGRASELRTLRPMASIRLVNRVPAFSDRYGNRQVLQIAEDGAITDEERGLDGIGQAAVPIHCGEVMSMKTQYPYVPNMDDCKMVVKTAGATCYIMDTCCRNMTKEQKEQIDREIVEIYLQHALRKQAKDSKV